MDTNVSVHRRRGLHHQPEFRKHVTSDATDAARRLHRWLRPGPWLRGLVFWSGAVATGATAVAFARGSDAALALFHWGVHRTALWSWLAPPLGLGLVAWLTQRVFPGT